MPINVYRRRRGWAVAAPEYSDLIALLQSEGTFNRSTTGTYFDSAGVMQTAAIDELRINYDPATLQSRGYLDEPQGTNIRTYSNDFKNAAYNKLNGITIQDSADGVTELSPDGSITSQITSIAAGSRFENYPLLGVDNYVYSHFMKKGSVNTYVMRVDPFGAVHQMEIDMVALTATLTLGGGVTAPLDYGVIDTGNGWVRVWMSFNNASAQNVRKILYVNTGTFLHFGNQVEVGTAPSSYIPTVASSVTRAEDIASLPTATWYNATEGTFVIEFESTLANPLGQVLSTEVVIGTLLKIRLDASNDIKFFVLVTSNVHVNQLSSGIVADTLHKVAFAIKENDCNSALDGVADTADTVNILPNVSNIRIGGELAGHIKTFRYYPTRKADTEIEALTT